MLSMDGFIGNMGPIRAIRTGKWNGEVAGRLRSCDRTSCRPALGPDPVLLRGRPLDEEAIREAADAASGPAKPMDNTDFSFLWRKEMVKRFVSAALREIRGGEGESG